MLKLVASFSEYYSQDKLLILPRVSRAWRDIIFGSPKFWSRIEFSPGRTNMSLVKARVLMSRQYPLDITIRFWETIAPLATLDMYNNSRGCSQFIIEKINHLKFPSLAHASTYISLNVQDMQYPPFLRPDNAPSLKSLCLNNLKPLSPPIFVVVAVFDNTCTLVFRSSFPSSVNQTTYFRRS